MNTKKHPQIIFKKSLFSHKSRIMNAVISHNLKFIASSGGAENIVLLWTFLTGKLLKRLNQKEFILCVAISKTSKFIAVGNIALDLLIWNI